MDDAIREVHGVKCFDDGRHARVTIHECEDAIGLSSTAVGNSSVTLTPWQARYLASKLYRLSRRLRNRTEQNEARQ